MRFMRVCVLGALLLFVASTLQAGLSTDTKISYQGLLTNSSGEPLSGAQSIGFSIFKGENGGSALWSDVLAVDVSVDGTFSVVLGPMSSDVFSDPTDPNDDGVRYLQIEVNGEILTPRSLITANPYATVSSRIAGDINTSDGSVSAIDTTGDTIQAVQTTTLGGSSRLLMSSTSTFGESFGKVAMAAGPSGSILELQSPGMVTPTVKLDVGSFGDNLMFFMPDWPDTAAVLGAAGVRFKTWYGPGSTDQLAYMSSGTFAIDTTGDTIMAIGKDGWITTKSLTTDGFTMPLGAIAGYVLTADTDGEASWQPAGAGAGYWTESVSGTRIFTTNFRGIGRGGAANLIAGDDQTMTNFGVACTTGTVGGVDANCAILGGYGNYAGHFGSAIAGGQENRADADYSFVGGGRSNLVDSNSYQAAIIGGWLNEVWGIRGVIAGGTENVVQGMNAGIYAGYGNTAGASASAILGGTENLIYGGGSHSAILGGELNIIADDHSVVVGGHDCSAYHPYCFVGGNRAWSSDSAQFVWSDNSAGYYLGFGKNTFNVRATGGAEFVSGWSSGEPTSGVKLFAGAGSWSAISDRNLKENFEPVDGAGILQKIAALPITTWNYKAQNETIRHVGPVAQDFYAAFKLGEDSTRITTLDASGIALAGVQELHSQLEEKSAEIEDLRSELEELRAIVVQLTGDADLALTRAASRK